jgi:hypothetical protein
MSVASKEWIIDVISPAAGTLEILRDGARLPTEVGPGFTTPVEILLPPYEVLQGWFVMRKLQTRSLNRC